jgi:hypothetical protein
MDPRKEKRRNHRSLQEIDDFLARQRTMAIAGFFLMENPKIKWMI